MSIATVRIAPVEQWCVREGGEVDYPKGMTVEIITESMTFNPDKRCLGRIWDVTQASAEAMAFFNGDDDPTGTMLCEHMLEMD
jgi:hypothetical protein